MGIASSIGVGSGIDIQSLVTQLAQAEAQPALNTISRRTTQINARLSGLGTLKSGLSDLQSALSKLRDGSLFKTHQASSSDETALKATTGLGSVAGSYSIKVNQLAKAQKSITTAEFSNSTDPSKALTGDGNLSFATAGGSSFTINATEATTLEDLRNAINGASGNTFVRASIVKVDHVPTTSPPEIDPDYGKTVAKLVLTSTVTGTANAFTVTGTEGNVSGGLSRFFSSNLQTQTAATNAIIEVDGQTATRSTNTITDVLTGVTLNLKEGSEGKTSNLSIELDKDAIKNTINSFVTAYNKFSSTAKDLGKYGGSTDGSGSGNGALIGDSTLRMVSAQLRQQAVNTVSSTTSSFNSLAMIGIAISKEGTMTLDNTKLDAALSKDFQSVSDVLASSDGVAVRMYDRLSSFLQSGGPLDSQQSSLNKQLTALKDQKSDVIEHQSKYEAMLLKQFTAMDKSVGILNSTGTFLGNWLKKN